MYRQKAILLNQTELIEAVLTGSFFVFLCMTTVFPGAVLSPVCLYLRDIRAAGQCLIDLHNPSSIIGKAGF